MNSPGAQEAGRGLHVVEHSHDVRPWQGAQDGQKGHGGIEATNVEMR